MSIFIETQSLSVALTFSLHIKNIDFLWMFFFCVQVWPRLVRNSSHSYHIGSLFNCHNGKFLILCDCTEDSSQPVRCILSLSVESLISPEDQNQGKWISVIVSRYWWSSFKLYRCYKNMLSTANCCCGGQIQGYSTQQREEKGVLTQCFLLSLQMFSYITKSFIIFQLVSMLSIKYTTNRVLM